MLSDEDKRALLEQAHSAEFRQAARKLRKASQPKGPVELDAVLAFLNEIEKLHPTPAKPHPPVEYKRLLL